MNDASCSNGSAVAHIVRHVGARLSDEQAAAVMRAAGLEPLEPYRNSSTPWRSECRSCGSMVSPSLSNVRAGKGCRVCGLARRSATRRRTDEDAVALMMGGGFQPLTPFPGGHHSWRCRCLVCGHECAPKLAKVLNRGGGCPHCGRQRAAESRRTPSELAKASMVGAGLSPLEPFPGSGHRPWRCRCARCGRVVAQKLANVKAGGSCPFCSGWMLDSTDATKLMQAANYLPLDDYPGADTPWPCRCTVCGRTSEPTVSNVRAGKRCGYCSGVRIAADAAVAVMRAAGLEPLEDYPGNNKRPWQCRCRECGRDVDPTFAAIRDGGGCRYCANRGFSLTDPALLYLVTNAREFAIKVGVTSLAAREDRLELHRRHGWRLSAAWEMATGEHAAEIERAVLDWWRNTLGAPPAVVRSQMPQGGWSETASLLWVDVGETVAHVKRLRP